MEIEFNEKLAFLFEPARLKIGYGGRGAGKTDGYAIALIVFAMKLKLRILCLREIQNSIEESVKSTIESYIEHYGLEWAFDIKDKSIVCKLTGSKFLFSGLRHKINAIKSLAKIDIAWLEEANNTSTTSLDKLMPTIRGKHESSKDGLGGPFKLGPEIWISYNPELDDDAVHERYVINKEMYAPDFHPDDKIPQEEQTWYKTVEAAMLNGNIVLSDNEQKSFEYLKSKRYAYVVKVNYSDNKWFPPDLQREMSLLRQNNPQKYLEVWEGFTKQTLDGAIYAEEIKQCLLDGRRKHVPYDPQKPVFTAWDLGSRDKTAIWFIQKVGLEFNLIDYYENRLKKIGHYIEVLQEKKYNYSVHYLPHDADNETLANRSIATLVRKAYPNAKVTVVQRPAKKAVGINAARTVFELCNFDEKLTADGWQCLSRYAYKVDEDTGSFSKEPDHDTPWSHGCFTADTKILTREGLKAISTLPKNGEVLTQWGWEFFVNPHMTRKNASLVEVRFTNGYTVKCTPDHLFLTESGWKSAENLTKGSLIQSGLMNFNTSTVSYTKLVKLDTLYAAKHYIEKFGKKLSEKFLPTAIFTIGMKIKQIINFIILNVYQKKNICITQLCGNTKMGDLLGYQTKQESLLKFGISLLKVSNGTFSRPLILGEKKKNLARIVGSYLKPFHSKNFAVPIVLKHFMQKLDQLKRLKYSLGFQKEIVRNAGKILNMKEKEEVKTNNFVQVNAGNLIIQNVKRLNYKEDVWCLTVPNAGHFSLGNGAIVKNCDAFQTFALSLKTEADTKKPKREDARVPVSQQSRGWMGAI